MNAKLRELIEEFRTVFAGRSNLADSAIPPISFLIINALLGFDYAAWGSLVVAVLVSLFRLAKGQSLKYALGGLGGAVVAILIARISNRAEAILLPGFITGILTVIVCTASVVARRPLVAWTSHIARRWPLGWYWHPRVRPAYSEVTLAWAVFYAVRLAIQFAVVRQAQAGAQAVVFAITGWPATIVLLAVSYLYGLWRLDHLQGPSVAEFEAGADPPWEGQHRGF